MKRQAVRLPLSNSKHKKMTGHSQEWPVVVLEEWRLDVRPINPGARFSFAHGDVVAGFECPAGEEVSFPQAHLAHVVGGPAAAVWRLMRNRIANGADGEVAVSDNGR